MKKFINVLILMTLTISGIRSQNEKFSKTLNVGYRETTVPIGVNASYYFDEWLKASERWDFYIRTSIGVAYKTTSWESGYDVIIAF